MRKILWTKLHVKFLFETPLTSEHRSAQGDQNLKVTKDQNLQINLSSKSRIVFSILDAVVLMRLLFNNEMNTNYQQTPVYLI